MQPTIRTNEEPPSSSQPGPVGRWLLLALHWVIIVNFAAEIAYAGYMVFVVFKPEGMSGPLAQQATAVPFELLTTRRLYAIEAWIATAGLAIYLAITEMGPRLRRLRR